MERLDFKAFEERFGPWAEAFKPFIESKEMYDIFQKLKNDAWDFEKQRPKETICPTSDNVFRAFATTHPESVKVIWYLMDPYVRAYKNKALQATGIAMDCSNAPDGQLQPSLKHFYEGIEKDLGEKVERTPDLTYLHEQGCMMLNTDLTALFGKTESHAGLWAPFQKYFLEEVLRGKQLIFVLAGKASEKMEKYISPFGNHILKVSHPSSAQYSKSETGWDHRGIFNKINALLKEQGKHTICWNKRLWDAELPF